MSPFAYGDDACQTKTYLTSRNRRIAKRRFSSSFCHGLDQIGELLANLFEAERADNGEK